MGKKRYFVILNERAGTAAGLGLTASSLQQCFEAEGHEAEVVTDWTPGLEKLVEDGVRSGADAVVAAGGDGTVTGVAENLIGTGMPLLILPMGTANLLARDLGIALDINEWFGNLDALAERHIDVASVNGRRFLHLVVIGLMPGIAAGRERVREHQTIGAITKFLGFLARRFTRSRRIDVELCCDEGKTEKLRVSAIAVGNNFYDEGFGRVFTRQTLDDGQLSLYLLKRISVLDGLRLAMGMVLGTWRHDDALSVRGAKTVTLNSRKRKVKAMFDGEPETLDAPLKFTIEPKALVVMAPPVVSMTPLVEPVETPEPAMQPAAAAVA